MRHRRKSKKLTLFDQIILRFKLYIYINNYNLLLPVSLVIIIIIIIIIVIGTIIFTHLNNSRLTHDFKFQHFKKAVAAVINITGIVPTGNWPSQSQIAGFNIFALRHFQER